ncbi:hypothetical protein STFR1_10623 [Bacillus vallismortis]
MYVPIMIGRPKILLSGSAVYLENAAGKCAVECFTLGNQ